MDWSQVTALTIPEGSVKQVSVNGVVLWKKGLLPSDYTQLEYIESTGTQWIDTGIATTNNNLGFMLEAMPLTNADVYPMGSRAIGGDIRFFGVRSVSSNSFSYGWLSYSTAPASQSYVNVRTTMSLNWLNSKKVTIGNDSADLSTVADVANGRNITLFGINGQLLWTGRIYRAQISEGNEIIANFIPVMRNSDSKVGMYDTVTGQFFTNAGTGEFIASPRFVEYLQSDSTAYIDTGVAGGVNTLEVSCTFSWSNFVTYGAVYGNYVSDGHNGIRLILHNVNNIMLANSNTICTTTGNTEFNCARNAIHTVVNKYDTVNVDGTAIIKTNKTTGQANSENIVLFNRSMTNPNTTRNIGLKIYSCQMYDSDVLIRDFRPALDGNNVACMYDMVTGTYFYNQGTGEFQYGGIL